MTTSPDRPPSPDWVEILQRNRLQVAYVLFGIAVVFAGIAVVVLVRAGLEYAFPLLLCVLSALLAAGTGAWQMTREPIAALEPSVNRLLALGMGGYLGLLTTLFGFYLMILWRSTILGGTEQWQGEKGWQVLVSLTVFIAGLAVMFVSFLVGRTEERSNATVRRIIYAYNAVLSSLLVFALLVVVNVLGYLYLREVSDWTASQLYTLSSKSKNILEGLDKRAKIFVLNSGRRPLVHGDVKNLLENCQALTTKLEVEYLLVHRQPRAVAELVNRHQLGEREGLLIVYGNEPEIQHRFIKETDLFDVESMGQGRGAGGERYVFKGEDTVVSAIESLAQGAKPIVYFTQGNGELELDDMDMTRQDFGLAALRERLERGNYEVKGLQFQATRASKKDDPRMVVSTRVPGDATAVVIAGPKMKFAPDALGALTEYMNRVDPKTGAKVGKLVVLLDVIVNREGTMVQTGLEKWLEDYNVEVGNNRVLTAHPQAPHPTEVLAITNRRLRGNPVADAFRRPGEAFLVQGARSVRPRMPPGAGPNAPRFRAEELLVVLPPSWPETNLRAEAGQLLMALSQNNPNELEAQIEKAGMVPVVLAVSETGDLPDIPAHRGVMPTGIKPRLVVFGDATFASNQVMAVGSGKQDYDFFASCLAWLRERPQSIGIEAKKRDIYAMDQGTKILRLIFLPLILMVAGIVGFGTGVWVVRRK